MVLLSTGTPFESSLDRNQLSPPSDASRADVWRKAIAVVAEERAPTRSCFLHRDYQHSNMPWARERLTGVVDWSEACLDPVELRDCESFPALQLESGGTPGTRLSIEAQDHRRIQ
jgi:hypothetical protein